MSQSLRDLLRQGADTVERPQLDVLDVIARAERRLVRRRLAAVAAGAAVVVLAVAGGFALRPDNERLAPAPPAPTETESPPDTPRELIFDEGERNVAVPPGVYAVPFSGWGDIPLEVADLRAVVTFPAGFMSLHHSTFAEEDGLAANQREFGFWTVHKVPSDFCTAGNYNTGYTNPGPTVADLATALAAQRRLGSTDPVPVTIGGYEGLYVELTRPGTGCPGGVLWFAPRVKHTAYEEQFADPGDVARIWILDVDGKRVVIDTIHPADASDEDVAQLTGMVESATFMTVE